MTTRRTFLAAAGAALIAPHVAHAQAQRPKRLAIVEPTYPIEALKPPGGSLGLIAFHSELRRLGWHEGANIVTEPWPGAGRDDRDEFVRHVYASLPDVVFASSYLQFAKQLLREAKSVPTVIAGPDPVATGIVASLARPGGMITGFSSDGGIELVGKRLQLLDEGLAGVKRVAYFGPTYRWAFEQSIITSAAAQRGLAVEPALFQAPISDAAYRRSFQAMAATRPDGVFFGPAPENNNRSLLAASMALESRLPTIGPGREYAAAGHLMSYGPDIATTNRGCAGYVDRILRGAKPADLPVQQPTVFELVVNLKTAKALGIELPLSIMALASEYVE